MEEFRFTIPANSSLDVNAQGNRIYCETATAPFKLKSGQQTFILKSKRSYVLKSGMSKFLLENNTPAPNTIILHIGDDEIIDNEVLIAGTISGDTKVINSDTPGKEVLSVNDGELNNVIALMKVDTASTKGSSVSILNRLQSHPDQKTARRPYTSLEDASYAFVSNATTTIVSAAENVNGVLIKHLDLHSSGGGSISVKVGSNDLILLTSTSGIVLRDTMRDFFIPPGQPIIGISSSINSRLSIFYEVL